MRPLVNVNDAAKELGLSKAFLYRGTAAGLVPCHRAGRALRFDVDEIRAWMKQQATNVANGRLHS